MNLGGGRVVKQDLPRIDEAIQTGSFEQNAELKRFIAALDDSGGTCHLMGLLSPGGVHSHQNHMAALAREISKKGVEVQIHAFLDGRDTPPRSAGGYLDDFCREVSGLNTVSIATLCGRYFAMDRDQRWERVAKAYDAIALGRGLHADDPRAAVDASYRSDITDEFVEPTVLSGYDGIMDGDGLLMANFRADRAREILTALLDPDFDGFERARVVAMAAACGMVEYSTALNPYIAALFPPETVDRSLGEVVATAGLKQLRIAETEKYAHVTFFFNGGSEAVFPGEDRILVPSPKVATYDLQPEMSAGELTDSLVEAIAAAKYDFIVVNYANPDMVGHTGIFPAALKAVETVDICLGRLLDAVERAGGVLLITADHGNIEHMKDQSSGQPHTAHTTNGVPAILATEPGLSSAGDSVISLSNGRLSDVAPTLLYFLGLDQPREMTGQNLAVGATRGPRAQVATPEPAQEGN
ncbi:MAG: 2,3-bisphosphoglycerate-independent phosphoglycerate mutase, partial [Rhodospirillales bacterium]|nr:2,3-bisphosphoglycerate-independent phosphoglycerate mutase [Rhodospirillales bacterium]